jgi:hypothetical protein
MSANGKTTVYRINPGSPPKEKATMAKGKRRAKRKGGKRRAKRASASVERKTNPGRRRRGKRRASAARKSNPGRRRHHARRRRNPGMSEDLKGALMATAGGALGALILVGSNLLAAQVTSNYGKAGIAAAVTLVGGVAAGALNPTAGALVALQSTQNVANSVAAAIAPAAAATTAASTTSTGTTTTQGVFDPSRSRRLGPGPVQGVFSPFSNGRQLRTA